MIERDSFIFYRSFYEGIKELDFEQQGRVYNALFGYALNGEEPDLTGAEKAAFVLIKPQIEANNRRYENGKKGGRPATETKPKGSKKATKNNQTKTKTKPNNNQTQSDTEPNVNENVNVNENDNKRESKERKSQFETPSLSQVKKVCEELGFEDSIATGFYNYYEANGWMQGRGKPILNWVAQLNVWASREHEFAKLKDDEREKGKSDYPERKYTREELDKLFDNLDEVEI